MADDVEVKLKCVRLSFFHGFDPQERRNDAKELTGMNYNCSILIQKTDAAQVKAVKDAMAAAKKAKWGDSAPRFQPQHLCLRDGEPVDPETVDETVPGSGTRKPLYDGYEGMLFVSANRPVKLEEYELIKKGQKKRPVRIIGPRKNAQGKFDELTENDPYAPYSGCFANVIIRIYGHEGKDGQPSRINASLEAVQFAKHGERFGYGGVDVDSAFDEEDVGEDDMGSSAPAPAAAVAADDFDIG
jgi:hypothetical protein